MSKKILVITGDAGESYETLYALHRFKEAGHKPVLAAPSKRRLNLVMHDFEPGWDTYIERTGYQVESDLTFDDVNTDDYDAVLVLGGRAPEYLRHNQKLLSIIQDFHNQEKFVFSICHGIQVLIAAGVTAGRNLTCYEHVRYELESSGATWNTAEAIRDGNFVSGQTWQSHPEFYREVFNCLENSS